MNPTQLAVRLYDHYESIVPQVKHYYGLLAIYALCRIADRTHDAALIERCRVILRRFPREVDHPHYNFPSYAIGGIPRAFMLMRGHMTGDATRQYVEEYAEEMMTAARDPRGIMCSPHSPERSLIWIDVAMAVTPYLLFAGLAFDHQHYIDEAAKQSFAMYEEFLDPANGLLHQSKNFNGPGRYSLDHWGRGNGWGLIALTELVQYLPDDSPHRAPSERLFVEHCQSLLPHQSPRGLWRQEIPLASSWEESSGTGLILYGYGVGLRRGLLARDRFMPAFERGVAALVEHCVNDDGSTELCCPGCLCPGEGERKGTVAAYVEDKQPVTDDGHSFAPIMLALDEAERLGVALPR